MYLEFTGKPTNEDVTSYPFIHLTSHDKWDPTIIDGTNPYHSITTDGGDHGSRTGPSEGSKPKII